MSKNVTFKSYNYFPKFTFFPPSFPSLHLEFQGLGLIICCPCCGLFEHMTTSHLHCTFSTMVGSPVLFLQNQTLLEEHIRCDPTCTIQPIHSSSQYKRRNQKLYIFGNLTPNLVQKIYNQSIENHFLINKDPNRDNFLFIFPHPSSNGTIVWVNSVWAQILCNKGPMIQQQKLHSPLYQR